MPKEHLEYSGRRSLEDIYVDVCNSRGLVPMARQTRQTIKHADQTNQAGLWAALPEQVDFTDTSATAWTAKADYFL